MRATANAWVTNSAIIGSIFGFTTGAILIDRIGLPLTVTTLGAGLIFSVVLSLRDHAVVRGWLAMLTDDPDMLDTSVDPTMVFPWRTESIRMLEWAADTSERWEWSYLLALNLWGRDRVDEARIAFDELGSEPDFAPFYTARALIGPGTAGADREADLRRAIELDPSDRNLRFPLVTFLHTAGRWEDAIAVSTEALADFPGDFDMELVHAAALVETQRYEAAIDVLERVHVLPSEHSSRAHTLFAQAHTLAGLAALEQGEAARAAEHFEIAMTWPERLGQGRPYEPEERLQQYALARALRLSGDRDGERRALEAVIGATPAVAAGTAAESPYDALAVLALSGLGRTSEGEALEAEHLRLARDREPAGLGSVEDRLLYRVLTLTTPDASR